MPTANQNLYHELSELTSEGAHIVHSTLSLISFLLSWNLCAHFHHVETSNLNKQKTNTKTDSFNWTQLSANNQTETLDSNAAAAFDKLR